MRAVATTSSGLAIRRDVWTVGKVDVGPVLWAGRELTVEETVQLPEFEGHVFPAPARVSLEIRRLDRGLEIIGSIDAAYAGMCDRCLGEVNRAMHLDVDEQFAAESSDPFAESNVLQGTLLDIDDLTRQLIDSALPLTILCSEECRGLCDTCGQSREACLC